MGEIRIVGPGKTHGYPYPVCKNNIFFSQSEILVAIAAKDKSCTNAQEFRLRKLILSIGTVRR